MCVTCTADVPQEVATLPGEGSAAHAITPSADEERNAQSPAAASTHLQRITHKEYHALVPVTAITHLQTGNNMVDGNAHQLQSNVNASGYSGAKSQQERRDVIAGMYDQSLGLCE